MNQLTNSVKDINMKELPKKVENLKNGLYVNIKSLTMFEVFNHKLSRNISVMNTVTLEYFTYEQFQLILNNAGNMRFVDAWE